jgi:hypothetical protein
VTPKLPVTAGKELHGLPNALALNSADKREVTQFMFARASSDELSFPYTPEGILSRKHFAALWMTWVSLSMNFVR